MPFMIEFLISSGFFNPKPKNKTVTTPPPIPEGRPVAIVLADGTKAFGRLRQKAASECRQMRISSLTVGGLETDTF
jgi:hypothetical protein